MADKKISQLSNASTPLAGTEVLPIVQSSATVKVATDDLTVKNIRSNATTGILQVTGPATAATRTMTVPDANFTAARVDAAQSFTGDQTLSTGNLIVGTAGKGIDFSSATNTPGMTSELLNDYEEGTFTPVFVNLTTNSGTPTPTGIYTKIGRLVYVTVTITGGFTTATANSTYCTMPFITSGDHVCAATNSGSTADYGNGLAQSNKIFVPSWANQTGVVIASTFIV